MVGRIRMSCRSIFIQACKADPECPLGSGWTIFVPPVEAIVMLAEEVVALESTEIGIKHVFSFDVSIVNQLFSVVQRCRDPHVGRRSIALLRSMLRQEGILNSILWKGSILSLGFHVPALN